jgi:hypothetical protein
MMIYHILLAALAIPVALAHGKGNGNSGSGECLSSQFRYVLPLSFYVYFTDVSQIDGKQKIAALSMADLPLKSSLRKIADVPPIGRGNPTRDAVFLISPLKIFLPLSVILDGCGLKLHIRAALTMVALLRLAIITLPLFPSLQAMATIITTAMAIGILISAKLLFSSERIVLVPWSFVPIAFPLVLYLPLPVEILSV